jgi:hypothetical protein
MATCIPCGRRGTIEPGLSRRVKVNGEWVIQRIVDCEDPACGSRLQEIRDLGPTSNRYICQYDDGERRRPEPIVACIKPGSQN